MENVWQGVRPLGVVLIVGLSIGACTKNGSKPGEGDIVQKTSHPVRHPGSMQQLGDAESVEARSTDPSHCAPHLDESLNVFFSERQMHGGIALYFADQERVVCSDLDVCARGYSPASTYKIPHTLIGLESGAIEADHTFVWDGLEYTVPAWNQDHSLGSAMEVSCVPCFQQLARSIGPEAMTTWLEKLDYGNATLGGPIDRFWLKEGGLRISPLEQLRFLWRLDHSKLPVTSEARANTISVIPATEGEGWVLRAKTGMLGTEPAIGWLVGWLERDARAKDGTPGPGTVYFATVIDDYEDKQAQLAARREISAAVLSKLTGVAVH